MQSKLFQFFPLPVTEYLPLWIHLEGILLLNSKVAESQGWYTKADVGVCVCAAGFGWRRDRGYRFIMHQCLPPSQMHVFSNRHTQPDRTHMTSRAPTERKTEMSAIWQSVGTPDKFCWQLPAEFDLTPEHQREVFTPPTIWPHLAQVLYTDCPTLLCHTVRNTEAPSAELWWKAHSTDRPTGLMILNWLQS